MPSSRSAGERAALIGLGLVLAAGAVGAAPGALRAGPAGKEPPPNLLVITVDTLRADRLSCYGGRSLKTETMDRLAARGVVFRRAFAQATTTLPSHTNMFLGLTPLKHGVHDNGNFVVGKGVLTLAEHLKAAGYATAAFIGGFPLDSRFGLDRGFDLYDETLEDRGTNEQAYRERPAGDVVANALRWLNGRTGPWFAWVHCYDPHHPYEPPEPFLTDFKGRPYDGEVAYVDQSLKKLLDAVDGLDGGRTVIILTGDHGESLGQHGEDTHGFLAYNTTLWIPLIVAAPGLKSGRVDQTVVHTDLFPTVCDLLGLRVPSGLDGLSLLPAIRGRKLPQRAVYFESMFPYFSRGWAPIDGYIQGSEKFIDSPIPELFDLGADFDESRNFLAGGDAAKYRARLAQVTGGRSPMDRIAEEKPLDREAMERLRSLGYLTSPRPVRKPAYGPRDDVKVLLPLHNKCGQAQTLFESGRSAAAIELLKSVLTEREDFDGGYATLGVIYARLGRVGDALTVLRRGVELNPDNYLIASPLVHLLNKVGRFDETIRVIAADGRYPFEHEFDSWNALGVAYLNTGDLERARQAFGSALDLDGKDYLAHRNLGDVEFADYRRTKDPAAYDKALAYYLRAIELNPRDPSSRNALGFTYLQGGRPKEAIPPLLKALDLFPDYDTAVYNLGLAYFNTGDFEKALSYLTRFREKYSSPLTPAQLGAVDALIRQCRARLAGR
jgi:arylsulfatase A-like enzyme/Flp pilus assembly protein TadD